MSHRGMRCRSEYGHTEIESFCASLSLRHRRSRYELSPAVPTWRRGSANHYPRFALLGICRAARLRGRTGEPQQVLP